MRLGVFPASKEVSSLARYIDELSGYDDVSFITPPSRRDDGKDFMILDGGEFVGHSLTTDLDSALNSCDNFFLASSSYMVSPNYQIMKLDEVQRIKKHIYIDNIPFLKQGKYADFILPTENSHFQDFDDIFASSSIYSIPVPVIFVVGLGPNTNKFEVQIALRKALRKSGYSVTQIGSKRLSYFFGFGSFPEIVYSRRFTIREKIIYLNRFFYHKYIEEKPDIIIIGVPGSIMPLNHLKYEEVCEMPFLLSQAISPDLAVLCIYAHNLTNDFINMLKTICKYRYNITVKHFVVSNTQVDLSPETSTSTFSATSLSYVREILAQVDDNTSNIFAALCENDMTQLGGSVINSLMENL